MKYSRQDWPAGGWTTCASTIADIFFSSRVIEIGLDDMAQLFFLPRVLRYFSYFPTGDQSQAEFYTRVHIGTWKIFALRIPYLLIFFKLLLQNRITIYICYLGSIYFHK